MSTFRAPSIVTLVLLLVGCTAPAAQVSQPPSVTPGASRSSDADPTASPLPKHSPAPTDAPSASAPAPSGLVGIAEVVTTDLVVRSAPGTGPDSEVYTPSLSLPQRLYVLDGPVAAGGYEWYRVLPFDEVFSDLPTPKPGPGWVAAAGQDGEPWIGPWTGTCPPPSVGRLMVLTPLFAWICFGDRELVLEGTLWDCSDLPPESDPPPELGNRGCLLVPPGLEPRDLLLGGFPIRVENVAADVSPGPDASVRVTGQYIARDCAESLSTEQAPGPFPPGCSYFVATEITPTSGP